MNRQPQLRPNGIDTARLAADRVEIRPIRPGDAAPYVEFLQLIDRESQFLGWEPGERPLDVAAVRAAIDRADPTMSLHLLAVDDSGVVGFLVCHRPPVRRLRHRADFTMAVLQRLHGHGIGTRLLAALDTWAHEQGVDRLELTVMAHNRRAIALYRRAGYLPEGTKRGSIRVQGRPVDELMMGKNIVHPTRQRDSTPIEITDRSGWTNGSPSTQAGPDSPTAAGADVRRHIGPDTPRAGEGPAHSANNKGAPTP